MDYRKAIDGLTEEVKKKAEAWASLQDLFKAAESADRHVQDANAYLENARKEIAQADQRKFDAFKAAEDAEAKSKATIDTLHNSVAMERAKAIHTIKELDDEISAVRGRYTQEMAQKERDLVTKNNEITKAEAHLQDVQTKLRQISTQAGGIV